MFRKQTNLNAMIDLIDYHIARTQQATRRLKEQPERELAAINALLPEIERVEKQVEKARRDKRWTWT